MEDAYNEGFDMLMELDYSYYKKIFSMKQIQKH